MPTHAIVSPAENAGMLNNSMKATTMPMIPITMNGRRRPQECVDRSDQEPTKGSQTIDQSFGIKISSAATDPDIFNVSVQKYISKTAGTVEKTPVPNDPIA